MCNDTDIHTHTQAVHSLPAIERIYDFFLASHPLMCLYFSASLLRLFRKPLIDARGDYSNVHATMQHLPNDLPLEELIRASHRYVCIVFCEMLCTCAQRSAFARADESMRWLAMSVSC